MANSETTKQKQVRPIFRQALRSITCLLILVVTGKIVVEYLNYFPPNFTASFLQGREDHFFGSYQWAFYPHLVAGPISLIMGMILLSDRFRVRYPGWHARLGKVQVAAVLLVLTPSGFWMSLYAQGDLWVKTGFASLSILTGTCICLGWKTVVCRNFKQHRIWMWRSYVLLCSAVVTRLLGGTFLVLEVNDEWTYYLAAWASWLVPLILFESWRSVKFKRVTVSPDT